MAYVPIFCPETQFRVLFCPLGAFFSGSFAFYRIVGHRLSIHRCKVGYTFKFPSHSGLLSIITMFPRSPLHERCVLIATFAFFLLLLLLGLIHMRYVWAFLSKGVRLEPSA